MFLISALGLLLAIIPTTGAADTLDLEAYRQAIQSAISNLQRDPSTANDVADQLRSIEAVRLTSQATVEPDLRGIVFYLEATPPQIDDAETSLNAILTQIDRSQVTTVTPDEVQAADANLTSILARSEFKPRPKTPSQSIYGWLGRKLAPFIDPLRVLILRFARWLPSTPAWTVFAVVVGLLIIGAIILGPIRGIRRGFGPATARIILDPGRRVSALELRQEAESLALGSSYRLAIRALYLAALVRLDEQGVLTFERALTNREVLRAALARGGANLAEHLAPLVNRFDQCWYGSDSCSESDYREFVRLASWAWEAA